MNDVRPGLDGWYHIYFVTRRPRFPLPGPRYVEDYEAWKNVKITRLDPLKDDFKQMLKETWNE